VTYASLGALSARAAAALHESLALNPGLTLRFWNDTDATSEVRTRMRCGERVAAAYASLRPPVARADLLRWCVLLVHGGVYLDADALLLRPLHALLRADDRLVLAREAAWWPGSDAARLAKHLRAEQRAALALPPSQQPRRKVANWMMAAEAGHGTVARVLDELARNVLAWRETPATRRLCLRSRILWTTGPSAITLALGANSSARFVHEPDFGPFARRKAVAQYGGTKHRADYWCTNTALTGPSDHHARSARIARS